MTTETDAARGHRIRLGPIAAELLRDASEISSQSLDQALSDLMERANGHTSEASPQDDLGQKLAAIERRLEAQSKHMAVLSSELEKVGQGSAKLATLADTHIDCTNHWGREMCSQLTRIHIVLAAHCADGERAKAFVAQMQSARDVVSEHLLDLSKVVRERLAQLIDRGAQNREREEEQNLPLELARGDEDHVVPERDRGGMEK